MSDWMRSDDPDQVEYGCQVVSATYQDSAGFVYGVVIGIDPMARTVDVVPNLSPREKPHTKTLSLDELDMGLTKFDTRNAAIAAIQIAGWLASLQPDQVRTTRGVDRWAAIEASLFALAAGGQWLPECDQRFQRMQAEKRFQED